jgi:hypothetical protein
MAKREGLTDSEAMARLVSLEDGAIAKHGWFAHIVPDDNALPYKFNAHTHGMAENKGHPDFQIVLPLDHETTMGIFWRLAERIDDGERFDTRIGEPVDRVIQMIPVAMARATEGDREVLRVILPDPQGKVLVREIDPQFLLQYPSTHETIEALKP